MPSSSGIPHIRRIPLLWSMLPVPGICGTGVTSEKITLPDSGLNGWKHTEIYRTEQKYWIYITLSDPDTPLQGNTLQLESTLPLAVWYTLESDFNRIF